MTDQGLPEDEDELLVAEYVVGVLPQGERVVLAQRLDREPPLRARLREWDEWLAPLARHVESVAPSPEVWASLSRRLFGQPSRRDFGWGSLALWRSLTAASLALALIAVAAAIYLGGGIDRGAPERGLVAELRGEIGAVRLVAFYEASSGRLIVSRVEGSPPPGRAFELWLIEGGNQPVSLGTLPAEERAALALPSGVAERLAAATLAVSDEAAGCSCTGQTTGPGLATGCITDSRTN